VTDFLLSIWNGPLTKDLEVEVKLQGISLEEKLSFKIVMFFLADFSILVNLHRTFVGRGVLTSSTGLLK
jgi:hypothetical protein